MPAPACIYAEFLRMNNDLIVMAKSADPFAEK